MKRTLHIVSLLASVFLGFDGFAQCNVNITTTSTAVSCYNGTNGSITCSGSGGSGSYEYNLSSGVAVGWQSSGTFTNLQAGSYVVSVRDKNSTSCIASSYVTVSQPSQIAVNATVTNTSCSNSTDGKVSIAVSGGTGPYTYAWTQNNLPMNGQTGSSISSLAPGIYNAIVTDKNGCTQQITNSSSTVTTPLGLTGFNKDVIASGSYNASTWSSNVNSPVDLVVPAVWGGTDFYVNGFVSNGDGTYNSGGLPTTGQFTSSQSSSRAYTFASYTANNSLYLNGVNASGTLSLSSQYQSAYQTLYVLCTSANGQSTGVNYSVNFSDGTKSTGSFTAPDWAAGSTSALSGLSRVGYSTSTGITPGKKVTGAGLASNFYLYEEPISIAANTKTVTGITFTNQSLTQLNIFAITGTSFSSTGVRVSPGATQSVTPSVSINYNPNSLTYCNGEKYQFTANGTNLGNNPTYTWSSNSANTSFSSTSNVSTMATLNGTGSQTITLTVIPDASLTCLTSNSVSSSRTFTSGAVTPTVSISVPASTVCAGDSVIYTANSTNGGITPTYTWFNESGTQLFTSTTDSTYRTVASTSGSQSVYAKLASSISCATPNPATSTTRTVTVNATNTPSVTISGTQIPTNAGATNSYQLGIKNSANLGSSPTYQWYKNYSPISGATSSSYVANSIVASDEFSLLVNSTAICPVPPTVMSNYINMVYILPIQMSSFSVSNNRNIVNVHWQTAMEVNVKDFEVQRADQSNPNAFVTIGIVAAKNTQGNTYDYPDNVIGSGTYYYRIKSVDLDGKYELSNIQSVSINGTSSALAISPNPVVSTAILSGVDAGSTVMILDMSGQVLRTEITNNTTYTINASGLPSGIYIVRTVNKTGSVKTIKFMKQ